MNNKIKINFMTYDLEEPKRIDKLYQDLYAFNAREARLTAFKLLRLIEAGMNNKENKGEENETIANS